MSRFFSRNIDGKGRRARAWTAVLLFVGALVSFAAAWWLGLLLLGAAIFVVIEAASGWCALRACGIKTKL